MDVLEKLKRDKKFIRGESYGSDIDEIKDAYSKYFNEETKVFYKISWSDIPFVFLTRNSQKSDCLDNGFELPEYSIEKGMIFESRFSGVTKDDVCKVYKNRFFLFFINSITDSNYTFNGAYIISGIFFNGTPTHLLSIYKDFDIVSLEYPVKKIILKKSNCCYLCQDFGAIHDLEFLQQFEYDKELSEQIWGRDITSESDSEIDTDFINELDFDIDFINELDFDDI